MNLVINLVFWLLVVVVVFFGSHVLLAKVTVLLPGTWSTGPLSRATIVGGSFVLTALVMGLIVFFAGRKGV